MYSIIPMNSQASMLMLEYYNNENMVAFQSALDDILLPIVREVNHGMENMNEFYREENNVVYIEKVMEDSLAIISLSGRNEQTIHDFKSDLKFSLNTLLKMFNENADNMDTSADYLMSLNGIIDYCDEILSYIIDNKNNIYSLASSNVIEIKNSMEQLSDILISQLGQMEQTQHYTLSILNKVKKVQQVLYKE